MSPAEPEEDWGKELLTKSRHYYTLSVPETAIHFVDVKEEFVEAVQYISQVNEFKFRDRCYNLMLKMLKNIVVHTVSLPLCIDCTLKPW